MWTLARLRREYVLWVLREARGERRSAARTLGVERSALAGLLRDVVSGA